MTVPPPSASRPPWARSSVRSEPTQPVPVQPLPTAPSTPQDSVPQDAPYATGPVVAAAAPARWSGKKTAAVAAIALALTSAGAVVGAAASPRGFAGPSDRDGRGGPGTFQNRQFGPPGAPGQGGPGQRGQQNQQNPQSQQGQQGQPNQQSQPNQQVQPNQQGGQPANT